jgi:hypothetical protein
MSVVSGTTEIYTNDDTRPHLSYPPKKLTGRLSEIEISLNRDVSSAAVLLKIFPVPSEACYGASSKRTTTMQKRKTLFDQVPVEVAEKVLRQQTSEPKAVAAGCLLLRNPAPTRVSRIRRLRRRHYG